jgi:hypothetical protein
MATGPRLVCFTPESGHSSGGFPPLSANCGNGSQADCYGRTIDLVWLPQSSGGVVDVPLILESEWGVKSKDIREDFEKLLLGRAQHRAMVFQQRK